MNGNKTQVKILIVDDEKANLFAYSRLLGNLGLQVDTAETVKEAVSRIADSDYHVVLTDIRFDEVGDEGGFEILKIAKKSSLLSRVIMITAYGDRNTEKRAYSLGADYYFEKPLPFDVLKHTLIELGLVSKGAGRRRPNRTKSARGA